MKRFVGLSIVVAMCVLGGCKKQPAVLDEQEGRTIADGFMELVRTGKAAQAWEGTSAEFKSAEGKEFFVRSVKKRPWLAKKTTFEATETTTGQVGERTEYVYRSADSKHHVRLMLSNTDNGWCVDRILLD